MAAASTPRPWTADEDKLLKDAVAEYGEEPGGWKSVAEHVPGRTNKACRKRWLHSLSPTLIKTPWTPEEDATLLRLYTTHQPARWSLIAKHIPGRTDDACSKRYREALDPLLKRSEWTPDEDTKLLGLTAQLGTKWTQVGQAMGRSGLACRNRFRLLDRQQRRPRHVSHPPIASSSQSLPHASPYPGHNHPSPAFFSDCTPSAPPRSSPFGDQSGAPEPPSLAQSSEHNRLINDPPPGHISTSSSLSGALASAIPHPPSPRSSSPDSDVNDVIPAAVPSPAAFPPNQHSQPERSPSPLNLPIQPSPRVTSSSANLPNPEIIPPSPPPPQEPPDPSQKPPKRPRLHGSASAAQDYPRLSSHLPATQDPTILPYACGDAVCWPGATGRGDARFATASEVAEHRRQAHPAHPAADGSKLYRCALQGCGKGWKNINGIQYHLQVSKAHFKAALSQTGGASSDSGATPHPAACDSPGKKKRRKEHRCPHQGCTNIYKQRSGLQYHLAHGHPTNVAQLEVLPPGLMRKIAAGMQDAVLPVQAADV